MDQNDKEILKFAAKAINIKIYEGLFGSDNVLLRDCEFSNMPLVWNPLMFDEDAFKLAVKLKLKIEWDGYEVQVFEEMYDSSNPICAAEVEHDSQTGEEATRRAIVLVAASIGKDMQ